MWHLETHTQISLHLHLCAYHIVTEVMLTGKIPPVHDSWDTYGKECESLKGGTLLQNLQWLHTGPESPCSQPFWIFFCHSTVPWLLFVPVTLLLPKCTIISQALIFLLKTILTYCPF